jgi:hypothetical protein
MIKKMPTSHRNSRAHGGKQVEGIRDTPLPSIGCQLVFKSAISPSMSQQAMHDGWTKMRAAASGFWVHNTHLSATTIQYFLPPLAISSCNTTTCYFFTNEQIESTRIRGAKKASRHIGSSSKSNTTIIKSISRTVPPVVHQHGLHAWMDAPFSHSKERVTSVYETSKQLANDKLVVDSIESCVHYSLPPQRMQPKGRRRHHALMEGGTMTHLHHNNIGCFCFCRLGKNKLLL